MHSETSRFHLTSSIVLHLDGLIKMRFHVSIALALVSSVAGLLVTPDLARTARNARAQSVDEHERPPFSGSIMSPLHDFQQKPLDSGSTGARFNVREQSDTVCRAGSRQWTGWIHVSEEKSLFFCKCDDMQLGLP